MSMHASFLSDLYPGPLVGSLCEVLTHNGAGDHNIARVLRSLTDHVRAAVQEGSKYQARH